MRGEINLLPLEYKKKPMANRQQIYLATLILLALFYMVYYGVGVVGVQMSQLRAELENANTELQNSQDGLAKLELKNSLNQILSTNKQVADKLAGNIKPLSPALRELNKLVPTGIILNNVETGENSSVLFKGTASSIGKVSDFADILNQSLYYSGASIASIQEQGTNNKGWNFEITCTWQKGGGRE